MCKNNLLHHDSCKEQRKQFYKIKCPLKECNQELVLSCPFCHQGALQSETSDSGLLCDHCKRHLQGINCSCGFTLSASYIHERIKTLRRLQRNADPQAYTAIGKTFAFIAFGMLLLTMIG